MATVPPHFGWLSDTGERVLSTCGREIEIWQLDAADDPAVLSDWARHFRQHYCADADLPAIVAGSGLTNEAYLIERIFPHASAAPGPSVRSGDFSEILLTDYLEYALGCWCPREFRYSGRWNPNDSTKGCDVVGFKPVDVQAENPGDTLYVFEVKGGMSASASNRLQVAIEDSFKDATREAFTLHALKRHMLKAGQAADAARVTRYQLEADRPFRRINGAAVVLDSAVAAETDLTTCDATGHPNKDNLQLVVVRGPALMTLVHALYARAANEA